MDYFYKKQNLLDYIKQAKKFLEAERVPNYEKYISAISEGNPVLEYLDSVLFVVDLSKDKIVFVSENAFDVEGYQADELTGMSATAYMSLMHPTDASLVVNHVFVDGMTFTQGHREVSYNKIKTAYNYRLKQKSGNYKMLMQQFSFLKVDEQKNPLMLIGTVSDITDLHQKRELFCRITRQNSKGKWEKIYERFYPLIELPEKFNLSPKEIEIINFVHQGFSSKEIAFRTNRSVETINSQRKSILSKTSCKSMTEVVVMAKENGWV